MILYALQFDYKQGLSISGMQYFKVEEFQSVEIVYTNHALTKISFPWVVRG